MRIVIDMQGAQSNSSRFRGIGRYTLSLAKAMVRNRGDHEVFLTLNGLFPDTIEPIRAAFSELLPQENIHVWQMPGPLCGLSNENKWRRQAAELVREAFLASLKPDILVISSLFEGLEDDAVTSVGTLSNIVPTAVILYDLIPFIHRHIYLENPVVEAWYENKLDHLRRADLLLAISESSRQEGISYLGFMVEACVNISTAADPQFQPIHVDIKHEAFVRERYGLVKPFVMYTGGIDQRKNIEGLIRAYAKLPMSLRTSHQLAIICSIQSASRVALEKIAKEQGLESDELILTGFVPEEDLLVLYNLSKAFVFPSWHEGFGLPILEAMSCGCAAIGGNTSSVPEVIGKDDALFDPKSDTSIAEKLEEVLSNDAFRLELEVHGLSQAKRFSWDISAQKAIVTFETWQAKKNTHIVTDAVFIRRPKLAYISPLPPERSGISDYSAELLTVLSRHYDIDVIVVQGVLPEVWVNANSSVRTIEWFKANADIYDRVLYHFGNSHFHQHMFSLLEEVPGVVVLHDFFLSNVIAQMDFTGYQSNYLEKALYQSHGYVALLKQKHSPDNSEAVWFYPCNLGILENALGVVVHSEESRRLAVQWYGEHMADDWACIPLLRAPEPVIDKSLARRKLKLGNDDFVVCSFGLLGPTKLNNRLLDAWFASALCKNKHCVLIFVGGNDDSSDYGAKIVTSIIKSGLEARICITGWVDRSTFRHYLAAADVGVQLRSLSRGETSAAVLDCMNFGLATIVNSNGSMADLPDDAAWKLPDKFDDAALKVALETLWHDPLIRQQLSARGREIILEHHAPRICSEQYAQAIEAMYRSEQTKVSALTTMLAHIEPQPKDAQSWITLAEAIAFNIPPRIAPRQLLIDISILVLPSVKNGIQSVINKILKELLTNPPEGYRVEPVYVTPNLEYRYARSFTHCFLELPKPVLEDDLIEYQPTDLFLCLDLSQQLFIARRAYFEKMRDYGVQIWFILCDLFTIFLSDKFPELEKHARHNWLEELGEMGSVIAISKAVTDKLEGWDVKGTIHQQPFKVDAFRLETDVDCQHLLNNITKELNAGIVSETELKLMAHVFVLNFKQLESLVRTANLPDKLTWRVEGPFDSSYSLALLNRETALALAALGHNVALHSTEGPGDFEPNPRFLKLNPTIAKLHAKAQIITQEQADVTSRNLYPPRVGDMKSQMNLLHHYAWEESGYPQEWADKFNQYLQGLTCLSTHVQKIMENQGITVPMTTSGCGVDHWERIKADKNYKINAPGFCFLHVSSCFPRKGVDVMLKAYGDAFNKNDAVTLVIKTFANPHNDVHKWLAEAKQINPNYPDVIIIEDDLTDAQLKSVYGQCHALVGPSRAEGFGLPFAEAMLSGLPVITTAWGGQLDFCTHETAWLVDYTFTPAETHFDLFNSVWAEPNQQHLATLMREVYALPVHARAEKPKRGRELLLQKFKWVDVTQRLVASARQFAQPQLPKEPKIGWITTWNTKCGIATYSQHLINSMPQKVTVLAAHTEALTELDSDNVLRCWYAGEQDVLEDLSQAIEKNSLDTLVIQFNYGLFNFEHFSNFLETQLSQGITIILMLHATAYQAVVPHKRIEIIVPAFKKCSRLLVHGPDDLNHLKAFGLVDNVTIFPHGVIDWVPTTVKKSPNDFTLTSYGFFLPHKGLFELIDAVKLLHDAGQTIKLKMINAEYPIPESAEMVKQARAKVIHLGIGASVEIISDFLPDADSLLHLSAADLIVFPYQETGESSSAAVRYGLASRQPVAVTPLAIFDDVSRAVFKLPGCKPQDIAEGISQIINDLTADNEIVRKKQQDAQKWREAHSYTKLGLRLNNILIALSNQNHKE